MKNFNVLDFGAKKDGKTINSQAVQNAIDECYNQGGGNVIFESGEYVLSTVFLKSNVHIILEEGCTILGAESFYDYAPEEDIQYPLYQDSSHSYFHCSMFVGLSCENISITGAGKIDMRSVWDEDNVRKIRHRGPKCISLKECFDVEISGISIYNATDLAVYFAGCKNVIISKLNLRVYIDGISPDNCDNVKIYDCNIESGDDGIVFKTSYTLNRYEDCQNIEVYNCKVKSRCNAIKFGTESNNSFKNFYIHDCEIYDTRLSGIAVESMDGAIVDNIKFKNIKMTNVNAPIFIHLGKRLRGPEGTKIGTIKNISIENLTATGEYKRYDIMPSWYGEFKCNSNFVEPNSWFGEGEKDVWQMTSNICGLEGHYIENISLKNIYLEVDGGLKTFDKFVPEEPVFDYPEAYVYGLILPASGIYFRHIKGLSVDNLIVKTIRKDSRPYTIYEDII